MPPAAADFNGLGHTLHATVLHTNYTKLGTKSSQCIDFGAYAPKTVKKRAQTWTYDRRESVRAVSVFN